MIITKSGDRILIEVNKIKGKKMAFKPKKICFLFEPVDKDSITSLSVFKITSYDHDLKRKTVLSEVFNLEEKRRIIEGYLTIVHKTVVESKNTIKIKEYKVKDKKNENPLVIVNANCKINLELIDINFRDQKLGKNGENNTKRMPKNKEDFNKLVDSHYTRVNKKEYEEASASFKFRKSKKKNSVTLLHFFEIVRLLVLCNPFFK